MTVHSPMLTPDLIKAMAGLLLNTVKKEVVNGANPSDYTPIFKLCTKIAPLAEGGSHSVGDFHHFTIGKGLTLADYKVCLLQCPAAADLLNAHLQLQSHITLFEPLFSVVERIKATANEVLDQVVLFSIQAVIENPNPKYTFEQAPFHSEVWFALAPDTQIVDCKITDLNLKFAHESKVISARLKQIEKDNPALFTAKLNQPYSLPSRLIPLSFQTLNLTIVQITKLSDQEISRIAKALPKLAVQLLSETQLKSYNEAL